MQQQKTKKNLFGNEFLKEIRALTACGMALFLMLSAVKIDSKPISIDT